MSRKSTTGVAVTLAFALALFASLGKPGQACASDEPSSRYAPVPLPDDLRSTLKERINKAMGRDSLQGMQNVLGEDGVKNLFQAMDGALDSMLDSSKIDLEKWLESLTRFKTDLSQMSPGDLNLNEFKDWLGKLPTPPRDGSQFAPPAIEPPSDRMRDWLKDTLEQLESSRWGEQLRNTPGWQKLLADMDAPGAFASMRKHLNGPSNWLPTWRPKMDWRFNLRDLHLPRIGRLRLPFRLPGLPTARLGIPHIGMPSIGAPALPTNGFDWLQVVGWAALVGMAVYLLRTSLRPGGRAGHRGLALGPWPVSPASVTTRRQLVQAFDYLALLVLGMKVESWNHRQIAAGLAEKNGAAPEAAVRLAGLYELARYTEGPETLPERDRDLARQDLLLLSHGERGA